MEINPIAITQKIGDSDNLSINFTRKKFSDFIFSLIQTPSEETREKACGYDLTKSDIKVLVDKIFYFINTNNDLVHEEFLASLVLSSGIRRTVFSRERFFNVDESEHDEAVEVSITLSYLISFRRKEDEKSVEKQTVTIGFFSGSPGFIVTQIRATEFTWPQAIFNIINEETLKLEQRVSGDHPVKTSAWFWLAKVIDNGRIPLPRRRPLNYRSRSDVTASNLIPAFVAVIIILSGLTAIATSASSTLEDDKSPQATLFSTDSGTFVPVDPESLVNQLGWREAADQLRDSRTLEIYGLNKELDREDGQVALTLRNHTTELAIMGCLVLITVLYLLLNYREAWRMTQNRVGRIFLGNQVKYPRAGIPPSTGVFEAFAYGILGNLFVSLLYIVVQAVL